MLFLKSHGGHLGGAGVKSMRFDLKAAMAAACGFAPGESIPDPRHIPLATFDYFFPQAPSTPQDPDIVARLDRLAQAMVDHAPPEEDNSDTPALFTFIGQFIDHDITAGTDRESNFSAIDLDTERLRQKDKTDVSQHVANLRTGALDLGSVYGTNLHVGAFGKQLQDAMRCPQDRAKLLVGTGVEIPGCRPDLPRDSGTDVLRMERLVDPSRGLVPFSAFEKLTGDIRDVFFDRDGSPILSRAVIGDLRNDENLGVAQTHLMFVRLHNKIVDAARRSDVDVCDRDAVFLWARTELRKIYNWLIINEYLPQICEADTLANVLAHDAPLYKAFLDRTHGDVRSVMALPLEFSVAAFRFGHSQARPDYDWNETFGRGTSTSTPSADRANFNLLFQFSGSGLHAAADVPNRVPTTGIPDMERLLNVGDDWFADRNTRKIDTFLAPDLSDMAQEQAGLKANMKNLAVRNMWRAHLLNIPTGQACIQALADVGVSITPLSQSELTSGHTGAVLQEVRLTDQTPLWFYILKEAETRGSGNRLGPLGSRLVAETLAGLVIHGTDTYWNAPGSDDNGRWTPADGVTINGRAIDSFPAMMCAVGYL